jgi:nucleotide-binding universal stress UspA family protein
VTGVAVDRPAAPAAIAIEPNVRPVMLLTLNVALDPKAVAFAVETAAETGAELYICDAIPVAVANSMMNVARSYAERDNRKDLDAAGERAKTLGVRVTQMVFHNPKPVGAALQVIRDTEVGLLVFGADRKRLGRWSFQRVARKLRRKAPCLVWTNE